MLTRYAVLAIHLSLDTTEHNKDHIHSHVQKTIFVMKDKTKYTENQMNHFVSIGLSEWADLDEKNGEAGIKVQCSR